MIVLFGFLAQRHCQSTGAAKKEYKELLNAFRISNKFSATFIPLRIRMLPMIFDMLGNQAGQYYYY